VFYILLSRVVIRSIVLLAIALVIIFSSTLVLSNAFIVLLPSRLIRNFR
jgi:hypothetical protein